jgi:hypothetical protein
MTIVSSILFSLNAVEVAKYDSDYILHAANAIAFSLSVISKIYFSTYAAE